MLWQGETSLWKCRKTHAAILTVQQQRIIKNPRLKELLHYQVYQFPKPLQYY